MQEAASLPAPALPPKELWEESMRDWANQISEWQPSASRDEEAQHAAEQPNESSRPLEAAGSRSPPAAADPYAFNASAFEDVAASGPTQQSAAAAADPYAFEPSAFGDASAAAPPQQPMGADPFAFNAFAFKDDSALGQPQQPAPGDPYAFDPSAFGADLAPAAPQQPAGEDPFAFNASAFEDESAPGQPSAAAADPFAFDASAFGDESALGPSQPAPAADPFAFDAASFADPQALGSSHQPESPARLSHSSRQQTASEAQQSGRNSCTPEKDRNRLIPAGSGAGKPRLQSKQRLGLQKPPLPTHEPLSEVETAALKEALFPRPYKEAEFDEEGDSAAAEQPEGNLGGLQIAHHEARQVNFLARIIMCCRLYIELQSYQYVGDLYVHMFQSF